ncbi:ATP-binding protein [Corynebacterium sp.]|uniref:ATP-binding protein n=1 Tax=Corynebacterium sp. TaxID=1720 RepID=UPI0026E097DA|nr:ATP-binding protein [Corynebacterium sp.]MDO5512428.1 ATP-binding protein [Corynebacterium sp.]
MNDGYVAESADLDVDTDNLDEIVTRLRRDKGDNERVEAKRAQGGVDKALWKSVSSFANTDGGLIILGLDEEAGFAPTTGFPAVKVQDQIASGLRTGTGKKPAVTPVPQHRTSTAEFEGATLVLLEIYPMRSDPGLLPQMPCYVENLGIAKGSFKRYFDQDQNLSAYEIHALQTIQRHDDTDRQPVIGSSEEDLDSAAITSVIQRLKDQGSQISRGTSGSTQILQRINAVTIVGDVPTPTLAGLLALGNYPQQYFPQLFIDVTSHPTPEKSRSSNGIRFNSRHICDGPMPIAIDSAVNHIMSVLRSRYREIGHQVIDEKEIPDIVIREVVANAVMHRDYDDYTRGQQISVDIFPDRVEITNPGGLWGDRTVDNIAEGRSVSRNEVLARILSQILNEDGARVAENQGSGVPRILHSMRAHGLPAPTFSDHVRSFTVTLPRFGLITSDVQTWLDEFGPGENRVQDVSLVFAHDQGVVTPQMLRNHLGVDSDDARRELLDLVKAGKLTQVSVDHYQLSTVPAAVDDALNPMQQAIMKVLSVDHPLSAKDIADRIDRAVSTVRPQISELVSRGLILPTAPPTSRHRAYRLP